MKLYFYILEKPYKGKPCVRFDECEVIEKPKSYYPVDKFPSGVYHSHINKSAIGHVSGYDNHLVVLTEPNVKMAKEIFTKLLFFIDLLIATIHKTNDISHAMKNSSHKIFSIAYSSIS